VRDARHEDPEGGAVTADMDFHLEAVVYALDDLRQNILFSTSLDANLHRMGRAHAEAVDRIQEQLRQVRKHNQQR
jgi:hypothetical protein